MFPGSDGGSGMGGREKEREKVGFGEWGWGSGGRVIYYAGCLSNYSNIKNISLNKLIIHKINIEDNWVPLNSYIMYKIISNINIMFWVFIIHSISRVSLIYEVD